MITGMLLTLLLCFYIPVQVYAAVEYTNTDLYVKPIKNKTVLRAEIYEWRYKLENGKLYKRLYNCTRGEWVGAWILIE